MNREGALEGPEVWNDVSYEKLWLYNLHYFDDLNAFDADDRELWHRALIARWIAENPPSHGNGWEAYPLSLRIVNWCRWILRGHEPDRAMVQSLAVQARWLLRNLEYHILGNHLLANAKALVFVGLLFDGREAQRWLRKGMQLLEREWSEQVLADGGHFERSPMYHLIVVEDLLDLINVHRTSGRKTPAEWSGIAARMLGWARVMRHPDGDVPFFNDAAMGIAGTPGMLESYAARLGLESPADWPGRSCHLERSGYARLEAGRAVALLDMAPVGPDYLPGHAHADTLSFELSLGARRVVVNGGTSVYGNGPERRRQRSTAAHSTVAIDGVDSSEVWGGFRVARRARVLKALVQENSDGRLLARAAHDGYVRLPGRPVHERTWVLESESLLIRDRILGAGDHLLEWFFPLAPGLLTERIDEAGVVVRLEETGGEVCRFVVDMAATISLEPTTWHPRFGVSVKALRLRLGWRGPLPVKMDTRILWSDQ